MKKKSFKYLKIKLHFNQLLFNHNHTTNNHLIICRSETKSRITTQTSADGRRRRQSSIFQAAFPGSSSLAGEREDIYQAGYCGWYAETHNFQRQRQGVCFVSAERREPRRKRIRVWGGKQSGRRTPREYK